MPLVDKEDLKLYLTNNCGDSTVINKYLNLLDSFWHKNEGKTLEVYEEDSNSYIFTFTGNTSIALPKRPNSEAIAYIDGLQDALDDKVEKIPGKGLSTQDFTTELMDKLNRLSNYEPPNSKPISYIDGLSDILDRKLENIDLDSLQANIDSVEFFNVHGSFKYDNTQFLNDFSNLDTILNNYDDVSYMLIYINDTSNLYFAVRKADSHLDLSNCIISTRGGGSFYTDPMVKANIVFKMDIIGKDEDNSTASYDLYELDYQFPIGEENKFDHQVDYYFNFSRKIVEDPYIKTITKEFTNLSLLAIDITELLPAPGTGKTFDLLSFSASQNLSTPYAQNPVFSIKVGQASAGIMQLELVENGVFYRKGSLSTLEGGDGNIADDIINKALTFQANTDLNGGLGKIKFYITYKIIEI